MYMSNDERPLPEVRYNTYPNGVVHLEQKWYVRANYAAHTEWRLVPLVTETPGLKTAAPPPFSATMD